MEVTTAHGDIHADMQHEGRIKTFIGKWHLGGIALVEFDLAGQASPVAESLSGRDEFRGQVDAGNTAVEATGNKAGCTANATTDIERMIACRQFQLADKVLRRLSSTDMKLIHWCQFIHRDCDWRFADSLYTSKNSVE